MSSKRSWGWMGALGLLMAPGLALAVPGFAGKADPHKIKAVGFPVEFEANQGQTDPQVKYLVRGEGFDFFVTPKEGVLSLRKPPASKQKLEPKKKFSSIPLVGRVLRMKLIGAALDPQVEGLGLLKSHSDYLVGKGHSKRVKGIPHYSRVRLKEIYPGVNLTYSGEQKKLVYSLILVPGADPKKIQLGFEGANVRVEGNGNLVLGWEDGEAVFTAPTASQKTAEGSPAVSGRFAPLGGGNVGFDVSNYDSAKPLRIQWMSDKVTWKFN